MPPFSAQQIVVVSEALYVSLIFKLTTALQFSDGQCSSTCAVFSELLIQQAGVKQVAVGGRPFYGPMQHIGGVRGSQVLDWQLIYDSAVTAFQLKAQYNLTGSTSAISLFSDLPLNRSTTSRLNFRSSVRADDITQTPLQFVYEPADCRLFYTPAMLANVTAQWVAVAQAGFSPDESSCVKGSTGQQGSLTPPPVNTTVYANRTTGFPSSGSSTSSTSSPVSTFTGAASTLTTSISSGIYALFVLSVVFFTV